MGFWIIKTKSSVMHHMKCRIFSFNKNFLLSSLRNYSIYNNLLRWIDDFVHSVHSDHSWIRDVTTNQDQPPLIRVRFTQVPLDVWKCHSFCFFESWVSENIQSFSSRIERRSGPQQNESFVSEKWSAAWKNFVIILLTLNLLPMSLKHSKPCESCCESCDRLNAQNNVNLLSVTSSWLI